MTTPQQSEAVEYALIFAAVSRIVKQVNISTDAVKRVQTNDCKLTLFRPLATVK